MPEDARMFWVILYVSPWNHSMCRDYTTGPMNTYLMGRITPWHLCSLNWTHFMHFSFYYIGERATKLLAIRWTKLLQWKQMGMYIFVVYYCFFPLQVKMNKLPNIRGARTWVEPIFNIMSAMGPKQTSHVIGICKSHHRDSKERTRMWGDEFLTEVLPLL